MIWKKIKRKLRYNRKRSLIIIFFLLLACSFGVGYALLRTELSIEGTSKFHEASWDVHFANIEVKSGSVTPSTAASITNPTTVTFAARLENPNDFYEFNIDVVNSGTIDAMIDEITILPELTQEQQNYLDYSVKYSDGQDLVLKELLGSGTTKTLTVHFSYIENIDTSNYPTEDQSFEVSVSITYVQADDTAIDVLHYQTIYTSTDMQYSTIRIGEAIPNGITKYNSATEAMTAFSNRSFCLKHIVLNGIVAESYIVLNVSQDMAGDGLYEGVYTLRGSGATYNSSTNSYNNDSPYYDNNKTIIQSALNVSYCTDNTNSYSCDFYELLSVEATSSGEVFIEDERYFCEINEAGISRCVDGY